MVSVGGKEFEVRTVSDSQFHALGIGEDDDDDEDDAADRTEATPSLDGQTVFLLERASDFDVEFVSLMYFSMQVKCLMPEWTKTDYPIITRWDFVFK